MIRLCAFADEAAADLPGQIAALKRNGIPLLELRSIGGENVRNFSDEQAREYAAALADAGISVWSIGSPLGKVNADVDFAAYEAVVRRVCALAGVFGAENVRVFSFFKAYDCPERVFMMLARMTELAREYGVRLCHENEKEIYGDTAARTAEVLDRVEGLASVYDPANFLQVGEDAETTLALLAPRAAYYHVKDVIAQTGELVPAGYGDGRIGELIESLAGRDTVLTLEPHLADFAAFRAIDTTERKSKFRFSSGGEAFDAAADALKTLLRRAGYTEKTEEAGTWISD